MQKRKHGCWQFAQSEPPKQVGQPPSSVQAERSSAIFVLLARLA